MTDWTAFAAVGAANSSQWNATAFAGFSGVVVALLLLLARLSASMVSETTSDSGSPTVSGDRDCLDRGVATDDGPTGGSPRSAGSTPDSDGATTDAALTDSTATSTDLDATPTTDPANDDLRQFGSGELLANVFVTHGLFAGLIGAAAVYWEVPASALGLAQPTVGAVGWGVAVGLALYAANEGGAALAKRLGIDHAETLRELLAPESRTGWALLLGGALPVVAVGEELIFRGVLVGALAAGFDLPIWGLAVASSAAFAIGHGAQGPGGIVVTGLLGFALAATFVHSGSLLLVIVAHYVVNALEFVVHEGFDVEWPRASRP